MRLRLRLRLEPRSRSTRALAGGIAVLVAAGVVGFVGARTGGSTAHPSATGRVVPVERGRLRAPGVTQGRQAIGVHPRQHVDDVERSRNPQAEAEKEAANLAQAAGTSGTAGTLSTAGTAGQPQTLNVVAAGAGTSTDLAPRVLRRATGMNSAVNLPFYGVTWEPPDPAVAASPDYVLEMVNTVGRVTPRAGGATTDIDLGLLFDVNHVGADVTDPRVLWDSATNRWFGSVAVYAGTSGTNVVLAVSTSANPLGTWRLYTVTASDTIFNDQPRLALTSDKVVMSWDSYGTQWINSSLGLIDKAAVVAGSSSPAMATATDHSGRNDWFAITPAVQQSPSARAYAVYNSSYNTAGVLSVDGPASAPTVTEVDVPITGTSYPPNAWQPATAIVNSTLTKSVDTGDDRFESAVEGGGRLWVAGNDRCTPAGDTTARACIRLIEVSVSGAPALLQDVDAGQTGGHFYYPSVALDPAGNLLASYSFSSPTTFPSLGVLTQPAAGGRLTSTTVAAGVSSYQGTRWGDYGAAVPDPVDPWSIWVVGETQETASAGLSNKWTTAPAMVTVGAPAVTALSPSTGAAAGGAVVTVTGQRFIAGATTVSFGSVPATSVTVVSPEQLTATVPAGAGSSVVDVTVQSPLGSSAASSGSAYTYIGADLHASASGPAPAPASPAPGYWFVASDGGIFSFGSPGFLGSAGGAALGQPIVTMTATPSRNGYWLAARDGGVFAFGDAGFLGSTGNLRLAQPIVGMAATPSGHGYWLVASDGGIFAFGDAGFYGSTGSIKLNQPIVGMAATPSGHGYWLVARDGGIFAFGDAGFFGSAGNIKLNQPIVGMAATPSGDGYWFVAADGGIFSFGDAGFFGSAGNIRLNQPIVGMAPAPGGRGYWFVASDGGIFTFGDAAFLGSAGNIRLNRPIVGMA